MKKVLFVIFFITSCAAVFSQAARPAQGGQGIGAARVQGLKIEFITRYLKLTPDEAAFWTTFYEYSDALKKTRAEQPEDVISTDEKVLMIKKKYRTEFKKILGSDERAMRVFTIDREFNTILKAEVEKRALQRRENR